MARIDLVCQSICCSSRVRSEDDRARIRVVVQFESCHFLLPRFQQADNFFNTPKVIGDPGLDGWRGSEGHVLALKVVHHHENGDLRSVVLNLLAEPVR